MVARCHRPARPRPRLDPGRSHPRPDPGRLQPFGRTRGQGVPGSAEGLWVSKPFVPEPVAPRVQGRGSRRGRENQKRPDVPSDPDNSAGPIANLGAPTSPGNMTLRRMTPNPRPGVEGTTRQPAEVRGVCVRTFEGPKSRSEGNVPRATWGPSRTGQYSLTPVDSATGGGPVGTSTNDHETVCPTRSRRTTRGTRRPFRLVASRGHTDHSATQE